MAGEAQVSDKKRKTFKKSPAYPALDIESALDRARTIYKVEKTNPVSPKMIAQLWGLSTHESGFFISMVAALKKFGFMVEAENGGGRQLKLTESARTLCLMPESPSPEVEAQRVDLLKKAVMLVPVHRELWDRYQMEIPTKPGDFEFYLKHEKDFNEAAVKDFIKKYKKNLEYAKFDSGDTIQPEGENGSEENDDQSQKVAKTGGSGSGAVHKPAFTPPAPTPPGTTKMDYIEANFPLSDGAAYIRAPKGITPEDIVTLFDSYLKGWRQVLANKAAASQKPTESEAEAQ